MLQKDYYAAVEAYSNGILAGIVKIASKMGISTIQSYQGAKIFEALGLKQSFIDKYFIQLAVLAVLVSRRLQKIMQKCMRKPLICWAMILI